MTTLRSIFLENQGLLPEIDARVDYERAAEWLPPFGPTTLWAKHPLTGAQSALWYDGSDTRAAAEWMHHFNHDHDCGRHNLYQHVNLPRPGLSKKAEKKDIEVLRYIPADLDGDKEGRDLAAAWAAIGRVLIPPSFTVMSGAGFNVYWALKEPLPNTPENLQRVETLGKRIADLTGGDGVQNIDRVLRVPFTINWPNQTKLDRGRVPCPSGVVISR